MSGCLGGRWREAIDHRRPLVKQADVEHDFATMEVHLDQATIAAAQAEGSGMSTEDAVMHAPKDSADG